MMETLMTATNSTPPAPLFVKPKKAAALLGLSLGGVYNLLNDGSLPSIKIRGSRMIPVAAMEAFISKCLAEARSPKAA
jgi:excisionase family DNA binding protein